MAKKQKVRASHFDAGPNNAQPGKMDSQTSTRPERRYYLDWLRVLAVLGVFYAHTLSILNSLSWHLDEKRGNALIVLGTEWGMALFFFLAGANAWFALTSRTPRQFLGERFKRLVIPFIVGVLLFSPLQSYILGTNRPPVPLSLFQYYPFFFSHIQLGWNPQFFALYGFHLWFLAFLFLFSAIALVPFLYVKCPVGRQLITWISAAYSHRGGLLWLLFPLALIQIVLHAPFPNYQGWADFWVWFLYFVYGYLLLSNPQLTEAIQKQSPIIFLMGMGSLITLLAVMYGPGALAAWGNTPGYSLKYALFQLLWALLSWSWILFVLSFGMRFLNAKNVVIAYVNEAILPCYVLHYVIIVLIASLFVHVHLPFIILFVIVSTLSFLATLGVYELGIRHVPLARRLFGMKPKR